jgi:hypothetical protein
MYKSRWEKLPFGKSGATTYPFGKRPKREEYALGARWIFSRVI